MNRFCERFGVRLPIVLAGMAGNGISTPEMVAAVSEAGGLGTLAGAYLKPEVLRQKIRRVKELTRRPFAVNLLLPATTADEPAVTPELAEWLNRMRSEVGLAPWPGEVPVPEDEQDACFAVILEEKVPVFSFAMGLPGRYGEEARRAGMLLIGSATTVEEGLALAHAGVDAVVAQGGEAGGHRSTFDVGARGDGQCIGTMALVPLMADALPDTPVIAAGGIMDGRGVAAALALGADAVQLGTRFLACRESGAHPVYKESLLSARETDTEVTRAFSGRPARGLRNRMMETLSEAGVSPLPYPLQNELTREIRAAAAQRNDPSHMNLWAGQGVPLIRAGESAREIVASLMAEAESAVEQLYGRLRPTK